MGCGAQSQKAPGIQINITRKATEIGHPTLTTLPTKLLLESSSSTPVVAWLCDAVKAFNGKAELKKLHLNVPCTGPVLEPYTHMDVIVGISAWCQKEKDTPGSGSKYTFASKMVDTIPIYFAFWDTPTSDEAYAKMLVTYCEGAQAMILCFSVSSRRSFDSAVNKYYEEVAKVIRASDQEGSLPLIFAGVGELQAGSREVSFEEAQKQADCWKAACYVEVDPDDNENGAKVLSTIGRVCIASALQQSHKEGAVETSDPAMMRDAAIQQMRQLREAALRRLPDALTEVEQGNAEAEEAVKDLLANEDFTLGIDREQFLEMQAHCTQRLKELGAPLRKSFELDELARDLGELVVERHGASCRQDEVVPAPTVRDRSHRTSTGEPSEESIFLATLVLLSAGIDADFQATVAANCGGGSQASAPLEKYVKMHQRLAKEHMEEPKPRTACNLDVLRCVVKYDNSSALKSGCESLVRHFGTPARASNGFRADADSPYGYRQLVLNWRYSSGKTYGELSKLSEALWTKVQEDHAEIHNCRKVFDAALEWLKREELKQQEVVLICEVELLLREHLDWRKRTYLHDRIARSPNEEALWKDSR